MSDQFAHAPSDVFLEIGFGGGEHLTGLALARPDAGFIGAEPFVNGVATMLRHIRRQDLKNVLLWDDDVRQILPKLPADCLAGAYVMFRSLAKAAPCSAAHPQSSNDENVGTFDQTKGNVDACQ